MAIPIFAVALVPQSFLALTVIFPDPEVPAVIFNEAVLVTKFEVVKLPGIVHTYSVAPGTASIV